MKSVVAIITLLMMARCLDPYSASSGSPPVTDLVVDGFLNVADGTCLVKLSHVIALESQAEPKAVVDASVSIVDEEGTMYPVPKSTEGEYYYKKSLFFKEGDKVRLKIVTKDNVEYESALMPALITSPIDSVTFISKRQGMEVQVTTHNSNSGEYYYWKFLETWYYHAAYPTSVTLNDMGELVPLNEQIYGCWSSEPSSDILVKSANEQSPGTRLAYKFPLTTVPWSSTKIAVHYSIEVEQRSITGETYEYLSQLKKNTENLGTLFDPLPSSVKGNMRCITFPDRQVQGHFMASSVTRKRLFVNQRALKWPAGTIANTGNGSCFLVEIRGSDWGEFRPVWTGSAFEPIKGTTKDCADCRYKGGTNVQPDFWEW